MLSLIKKTEILFQDSFLPLAGFSGDAENI